MIATRQATWRFLKQETRTQWWTGTQRLCKPMMFIIYWGWFYGLGFTTSYIDTHRNNREIRFGKRTSCRAKEERISKVTAGLRGSEGGTSGTPLSEWVILSFSPWKKVSCGDISDFFRQTHLWSIFTYVWGVFMKEHSLCICKWKPPGKPQVPSGRQTWQWTIQQYIIEMPLYQPAMFDCQRVFYMEKATQSMEVYTSWVDSILWLTGACLSKGSQRKRTNRDFPQTIEVW